MKKILLAICYTSLVWSQNLTMPPMPPSIPMIQQKSHTTPPRPNTTKKQPTMPQECSIIPPMLIFMPPPLEADLARCKDKLYLPKKEQAYKRLQQILKQKIKIYSIKPVKGFIEVYAIKTDKGMYYCNKDVNRCFQVKQ